MTGPQQIDRVTLTQEAPVDPKRPIIDAHHHLWREGQGLAGAPEYRFDNLLADINGHNVVGTVFVECGASYRPDGPEPFRPVGETEFAAAEATRSASSRAPILGIVSFADITMGDAVQDVLEAHAVAGRGLFRGIRHIAGHDLKMARPDRLPSRNLLADAAFRQGLKCLGQNEYSFDTFVFHTQLRELAELIQCVPGTLFILNHLGVPVNRGVHGTRAEVTRVWRDGMHKLASCQNVVVKLGGIGMDSMFGMGWGALPRPPDSDHVVEWWGDDIRFCIDTFGPQRCIFESNFPVDRWSLGYTVLWNAFQKIAAAYSEEEQNALFAENAQRIYRLQRQAR
jgi:predicted TIM-barrel fold metal-dependent hydrolase